MVKNISESFVESSLKLWLKNKKSLEILDKQRKLPIPKSGYKSCKPDIIASTKMGKTIYIIECKKGTSLRQIGHAFGQLYVDELIIKRIKKIDWLKFIKKKINPNITQKPDIIFGVAFHYRVTKDKNTKKVINQFTKRFQEYRVYLVKNKFNVQQKKNTV